MPRFRINDGNAPGYFRASTQDVGKVAPTAGMQSPVISEAWARKYKNYTPTAPSAPAYKFWEIRFPGRVGWTVVETLYYYRGAPGIDAAVQSDFAAATASNQYWAASSALPGYEASNGWQGAYTGTPIWLRFECAVAQPFKSARITKEHYYNEVGYSAIDFWAGDTVESLQLIKSFSGLDPYALTLDFVF